MTFNGYFALKCVSGSATNELAFMAFGQNSEVLNIIAIENWS